MGTSSKVQKPDRFTPLLADIRSGLDDHWTFYEECIDSVLFAAANKQDTTAWLEQMQQLVEGIHKVQFSHEGVLFLLRDMGIHPSKQQSWGGGEGDRLGMYPSPPLSPSGGFPEPALPFIDGMTPISLLPHSTMSSLLPHRPLRPHVPAIAGFAAPRVPKPHTQQQQPQQQQQSATLWDSVLPFDFSSPRQPGLTFPKDLRAYHYPPEQVIMTEDYVPPPLNPLRTCSSNPIFFVDPVLREGVAELFGYTVQSRDGSRNDNANTRQARHRLSYGPCDDDMVIWRKRLEGGVYDGGNEVNANGFVTDTWPQWTSRFDLDL